MEGAKPSSSSAEDETPLIVQKAQEWVNLTESQRGRSKATLENLVALVATAPNSPYFSPLSHSLNPPQAAVVLQARRGFSLLIT